MSHKCAFMLSIVGLCWVVLTAFDGRVTASADEPRYEITVTNLTRGQNLTPAIVATHTQDLQPLFTEGAPASPALIAVAEEADVRPLQQAWAQDPEVHSVAVIQGTVPLPIPPGGFVIRPGQSATVVITGRGRARFVSLVGMLATTNDAFYALNSIPAPRTGSLTYYSIAWDAGSEANNEVCRVIPGPPCRNFFVRSPEGAEGFVHVHAGIHGIGNLVPAMHDWRNPVAKITIHRLPSVHRARERDDEDSR